MNYTIFVDENTRTIIIVNTQRNSSRKVPEFILTSRMMRKYNQKVMSFIFDAIVWRYASTKSPILTVVLVVIAAVENP